MMSISDYCEEGLLFEVLYYLDSGVEAYSLFLFSIDHDTEDVKEILSKEPYGIHVLSVCERGYVLKPY